MSGRPVVLQARGLGKDFGHVSALRDVSVDLRSGEVVAVVGDNGAGKSTLAKVISGVYQPDRGELIVNDRSVRFSQPGDAIDAGIATVYQDLALVDTRDVAANLFLGREFKRGPFVDRRRGLREAEALLKRLDVKIPSVRVPISVLSGGQRQAVAVARTLTGDASVVIMDEPTAALGVSESRKVIHLARNLADEGKAVLVVSHNLEQIWDVTDRFVVMRLGGVVAEREKSTSAVGDIVELIVYGSPVVARDSSPQAGATR